MKNRNLKTEENPLFVMTVTIMADGKEQEIIPVFSEFSMGRKSFGNDSIHNALDRSKILPTVFSFVDVKTLEGEQYPLFDYAGNQIPDDFDCEIPLMLYLDKADNFQLLGEVEEPLNAVIVDECKSFADAYQRVATSAYYSRTPNKIEWLGWGGIVTNDDILIAIRGFCNLYKVSGTVAQKYFGIQVSNSLLHAKALGINDSLITPKRTPTQAVALYKAAVEAFGVKIAGQGYSVNAINYCINNSSYGLVLAALAEIKAEEKLQLEHTKCGEKTACIQALMLEVIRTLKEEAEIA
ncbi:hypothetical protein AAE250_02390 [Bacteroides sp. GD17]|jgi:hypothetical protein|uniref:hypothetical protein n=1 Tax=Bacteroides sp. GD17 TaxID=3139826 RepID=UPI0025FB70CF|nr:hypothetical protein [uncultured Bacteroides sp.]